MIPAHRDHPIVALRRGNVLTAGGCDSIASLAARSSSMQLVPAIHGGDPDPTAALPEKLAAGGSGEDLWIAGASVLTRDAILISTPFYVKSS